MSQDQPLKFLALGDSYTIGESVDVMDRWPNQVVSLLRDRGYLMADPQIIAQTGWTTDELEKAIKEKSVQPEYDFVSLLIGVNNQYRGYDINLFKSEFKAHLLQAIKLAKGLRSRVFVLSIPDYGVTPFAQEKNPQKIAQEINRYNTISRGICQELGVKFFDITEHSRLAAKDQSLVAEDGLHPSKKMYAYWADLASDWMVEILTL
ncbi:MAG: SGNH/GDSL hydrolase family protein [Cyclobacteriaceae bacterium]|nr:SGNH/GDSL hydrolase family protein [Cyclobacteriaceae bacterium HetDA_MAG_MS6]